MCLVSFRREIVSVVRTSKCFAIGISGPLTSPYSYNLQETANSTPFRPSLHTAVRTFMKMITF